MSTFQSSKARAKHSWSNEMLPCSGRQTFHYTSGGPRQSYDIQSKKENIFDIFKKRWEIIYNATALHTYESIATIYESDKCDFTARYAAIFISKRKWDT